MASRNGVDDVLKPTPERVKFYRLTTLLIAGGTEILRQVFDRIHPPSTLATVLATVKSTIKRTAKLSNVQMNLLYPPTGDPVSSRSLDITLLFSLLRHICNLTAPAKGWDEMPDSTDHTLEADLARIKNYRNKVYGHVNGRMEVTSDQFNVLWQAINEALLRIVGTADEDEQTRWMNNILRWRHAPLEPDASLILLIQRLKEWHEAEKEEMKRITRSISDVEQQTQALNSSVQDNIKTTIEENSKTRKSLEKVQGTFSQLSQQLATETSAAPSTLHITCQGPINVTNYIVHDTNPDTPKPSLRFSTGFDSQSERYRPQSTPSSYSPPNSNTAETNPLQNTAVRLQYSTSDSFGRNGLMDSGPFSAKSEGHDTGKLMQLILVSYFV